MTATLERNRVAEHEADIRLDVSPARNAINISPEIVTQSTAKLPEEQKLIIRWLYDYARANDWSWDVLQGKASINKNTLYKVWSGRYTDAEGKQVGLDGICETIQRLKKLTVAREGLQETRFVETSVYKRIAKVCDEARVMSSVAFIYGESQIGKTFALEEVQRRNNHGQTVYCRMPAAGGEFFKELACATRISTKNSNSKIRDKLFRTLDHSKLLLVDELHLVFEIYNSRQIIRTMETLRELHDKTKCGLVLCGTNVFKREMRTGDYSKMLAQLLRRGILELQLPNIAPQADVDLIAGAYGLKPPTGDAADLVKLIMASDGLGKLAKYLAKAAHMAAKQQKPVSWAHFLRADELITKLSIFDEK